jgi:hypothetical protein
MSNLASLLKAGALFCVLWLVLTGVSIFILLPHIPNSYIQWLVVIVIGPPLYVIGELTVGSFLSPERGNAISSKRFSVLRIFIGFFVAVIVVTFSWLFSEFIARL